MRPNSSADLRKVSLGDVAEASSDDVDPDEVADGVIAGMNFTWCGQSCGSTSRVFLHAAIRDAVVERVKKRMSQFKPGDPTDPATTMGALISQVQFDKALGFIEQTRQEGATLLHGGKRSDDPNLAGGFFVQPTVFTGVTQSMRIAREEVFGPVLAVLRWSDEQEMLDAVNGVEFGLTCSIWMAFAPGGFADSFARIVADELGKKWKATVVVKNVAGAGGNTAASNVAAWEADGHSVLVTTTAIAINSTLFAKPGYNLSDMTAVAVPVSSAEMIATHRSRQKSRQGIS